VRSGADGLKGFLWLLCRSTKGFQRSAPEGFFWGVGTGFHYVARLALNLQSSCFYLWSVGITGMFYYPCSWENLYFYNVSEVWALLNLHSKFQNSHFEIVDTWPTLVQMATFYPKLSKGVSHLVKVRVAIRIGVLRVSEA
jgi:hypothetical protein